MDDGNLVMLLISHGEYGRALEELNRLEQRYLMRQGAHLYKHKFWLGWSVKVRAKLAPLVKRKLESTHGNQ